MADSMQKHVTHLMHNCKLAPQADAALHVLITELMEDAALVAANPQSEAGRSKLANALRNYPKYFDHPNWRPLPAPPS